MPMTKNGKPVDSELPGPVARSGSKAKRTFAKAHDAAAEEYDDGRAANQVAYAALKHTHEKVGDHWEQKEGGRKGPSDAQAAGGRTTNRKTAGGVDANATKTHLLDVAKRLDVRGRSRMTKAELVEAIEKANTRATAKARKK